MSDEMKLWWHVYGGEVPDMSEDPETGELGPAWAMLTAGEAKTAPEGMPKDASTGYGKVPYLHSFDHEPSQKELDDLTPEVYREGHEPA